MLSVLRCFALFSQQTDVRHLYLLAFTAGAVTLGMELSAARLLEPVFGNNQIVWAALIGLILLYLALGAWLGGRLADRFPRRRELHLLLTIAAVGVALAPAFSTPVLRLAATGLADFAAELLIGALLSVLLLFSVPGILLGAVSPWVVRLALDDVRHSGQIAGRIYAVATAGSLAGTFLPVLWLIPAYGTRWTFFLLALALLAVVIVDSWRQRYIWAPLLGIVLVLLLAWWTQPGGAIRATWDDGRDGEIIYEDESLYNYIAIRQWGSERHLKLNDGIGIHSVYHPDSLLSLGIWDYFLLAPLFSGWGVGGGEWTDSLLPTPYSLLIIGLAGGTVSSLYSEIYGPVPITGVELDPQIIEVGRRFFELERPNVTPIAADGRRWLMQQPPTARWQVIAVDAYRPPYIPFHLATVEFFALVRNHLTEDGVVAINVGRTAQNFDLVDTLAATLAQLFPTVYAIDEPGPADTLGNTLLVATMQSVTLDAVLANHAQLPESLPPEFRTFAAEATGQIRLTTPPPDALIFRDDHAPVEQVVHRIIWSFLTGG
ncbi:MAG: spermine synthase [Chloroflexi bacterium]|nr:MAG: spermine synthase [Chloroflexota bacterium]